MKHIAHLLCLASLVALVPMATMAQPTVLLRDNYTGTGTPDTMNLNFNLAGRQTGTLAPVTYTPSGNVQVGNGGEPHDGGNVLLCAFGGNAALDQNFNGAHSAGGLRISFDLDPNSHVDHLDTTDWGAITLGSSLANRNTFVVSGTPHFGILFRANGRIQAFDAGSVVSPNPEPNWLPDGNYSGQLHHFDILCSDTDGNPFDGVRSTIIEVFVDGGKLPVYTFTKAGGYGDNYINFQGAYIVDFENVEIARLPSDLAPVIANPSFEADTFTVFPGYVSGNGPITGWNALGGHGVNPGTFGGPFSDNGTAPDGSKVAFMQEDGPLSQVISGFTIGATYQIHYFENSRTGPTIPACEVKIGGQTIVAPHVVTQVGGANSYHEVVSTPFVATATAMQLEFIKSNPQGGDTTLLIDQVSIVLPNTPPTITVQPQDQRTAIGETATFAVSASGSAPLSYQWWFGDVDLVGQTGPTLQVPVQFGDEGGEYYVVVNNAYGSVTSRRATLKVLLPVPGIFNTGVDDSKAALPDGAVDPHYLLIVNADSASIDAFVEDSTVFPIVTGPWIANTPTSKWIGPRFETSLAAGLAQGGGLYVYRLSFDVSGLDLETVVITGGWAIDNAGVSLRVNDVPTGLVNGAGFGGLTPFTISAANATFIDGINTLDFEVRNDDAIAGWTGLRVANLRGTAELPGTPPSISQQPQSQLAGTGETVTFSVLAGGSSPLTYEWQKDGAPIPGAFGPTYTISSVQLGDAGTYSVVVSNPYGTATSADAVLTVRTKVTTLFNTGVDDSGAGLADGAVDAHYKLVVNPDSSSPDAIVENSTVFPIVAGPWVANSAGSKWIGPRFDTVAAAGGAGALGDYTYRLTFDVTGVDPASLVITGDWATDNPGPDILINGISTGQSNPGNFDAFTAFRITNGFLAGLNILDFKVNNTSVGYTGLRVERIRALATGLPPGTPPTILENPQGYQATVGDRVVLSVRANGSAPLSYQWFFGPDPLPGETGQTLTLQLDYPDQAGDYSVEVSNPFGSAQSLAARIEVSQAPRINRSPQSQLLFPGDPLTLVVEVSGEQPFTYQWYRNNQPIPGATGASFSLASVSEADAGFYVVRVANDFGTTDSAPAALIIAQAIPGFFNTGVDDSGNAQPDGAIDPHYVFTQNADSSATATLVQDSTVFPIVAGPWVPNTANSKWIGPRAETSGAALGDYTYRITFNLQGLDPATARITGTWAADDGGSAILINGQSTGQATANGFATLTPFSITTGFTAGLNTLDFRLNNSAVGYTGLRIDQVRALAAPLTNVNHAPSFRLTANIIISEEDYGPVVFTQALDISAGPYYEAGQTLTFLVTTDNSALFSAQPAIDATGTLRYTTAPNAHGAAQVTVVLKDNGGTANGGVDTSVPQTFQIIVLSVNDCPVASPLSVTVDQDSVVSFQLPASDVEGDALEYNVTQPAAHGTLVLQVQTGQISYAPNPGYCGPDSFKFRVRDGRCNSAEATVSITVHCLNEPPQCEAKIWPAECALTFPGQTGLYALSLDGEKACLVLSGSGSDPDGDPLQFSWAWDGANTAATAWLTNCFDLGCHTATLTVSDGRATCSSVVQFCVITAGEAVEQCITLVNDANLDQKNKRPLIASLKAAGASFDRGSQGAAENQLKAFQNKVRAQVAPHWPVEAAAFIRCTQRILDAVDCAATHSGN
jgi:hypothetical protein